MMEIEIKKSVKFNAVTLIADMGVRYWEDGFINGEPDDEDRPKMPMVSNGRWVLRIDLESGRISGWPSGVRASVHYKICDDGTYSILDDGDGIVASKSCYVPKMLSPKENGYGDYAIFDISESGDIQGWNPDLSYFTDEE